MADASIVIPAFRNHGLRKPLASLEPLAVLVDQRHQRYRHAGDQRSGLDQVIELGFVWRVQDAEVAQLGEAGRLSRRLLDFLLVR
jgi:hypothetical protein